MRKSADTFVGTATTMIVGRFTILNQTYLDQRFEEVMLCELKKFQMKIYSSNRPPSQWNTDCVAGMFLRYESLIVPSKIVESQQNVALVGPEKYLRG